MSEYVAEKALLLYATYRAQEHSFDLLVKCLLLRDYCSIIFASEFN